LAQISDDASVEEVPEKRRTLTPPQWLIPLREIVATESCGEELRERYEMLCESTAPDAPLA
jgi:hypothetical protein